MNKQFSAAMYGLLFLAMFQLAAMPVRGGTNDYTGSRWTLVDTGQVLTAARAITPVAYPDCDMATVEQKSVRVFRADGTGEAQDELFEKVLTEKGRRANRSE